MQSVKNSLNSIGQLKFFIPGLENSILKPDGSSLGIKPFDFNYLSNAGTATVIATLLSLPLIGLSLKQGVKVFFSTLYQLRFPIITIASIVGFAFIANNSGMSITIAMALASTGILFPFFSPVLGWLGVFLTGSDTSSNALFCKLQSTSADAIGVSPVLTVGANASGGVTGKMISPQSIAIGAASVGLVGKESEIFRFTLKHSFILLFIICVITIIQAYVTPWMIPTYNTIEAGISSTGSDLLTGFIYMMVVAGILIVFGSAVLMFNRKKVAVK